MTPRTKRGRIFFFIGRVTPISTDASEGKEKIRLIGM